METDKVGYNITKGPSKMDLMFSLFDKNRRNGSCANFSIIKTDVSSQPTTAVSEEIGVRVDMLKHEDGSGESWFFEGYITATCNVPLGHKSVKGWFRTSGREGWLEVQM